MSPNDEFRVIGSKPIFEDLNLSLKFSTDVAHLSTHPVYLYWSVSSNKKMEKCLGSWHLYSDNDTCESETRLNFK